MRTSLRHLLLVGVLAAAAVVVIPWAWQAAFPTPQEVGVEAPRIVSSEDIGEVNETLADSLAALGVSAEMVVSSEEGPRELDGEAWTFTRTTVDLPRALHEEELRRSFEVWPAGAETFLTQLDELTWSLRVYLGKRPIHQLVLQQPLDPAPIVDPDRPPGLAVVIVGVGSRDEGVEEVLAAPHPLTVAVLPYRSHSLRYATDAARAAKEVAVHLQFDGQIATPEPVGMALPPLLNLAMELVPFGTRLGEDLDAVPYASGAVLASDSPATADFERMEMAAEALDSRGHYLLDLLPVRRGVALQVAHRHGLRAASCAASVGATATPDERELALLRARNLAVLRGSALLVVHSHEDGLAWLQPFIEERRAEGYRLIFASELFATIPPSP